MSESGTGTESVAEQIFGRKTGTHTHANLPLWMVFTDDKCSVCDSR